MGWLAAETTPLPLPEFVQRLQAGTLPTNATAVTFDDAYLDNLTQAEPILRQHQIPATVFVPSRLVAQNEEPWFELLDALLLETAVLPEEFRWGALHFTVEAQRNRTQDQWTVIEPAMSLRQRAFIQASEWARSMPATVRSEFIDALGSWAGGRPAPRETRRLADWQQMNEAVKRGVLSFGAHTRTHPCLARLSVKAQTEEIQGGIADMRQKLDTPIKVFAHPFGTWSDFSPTTLRILSESGVHFGFANMPAHARPDSNPWQLPRLLVGDWAPEELARRLGR